MALDNATASMQLLVTANATQAVKEMQGLRASTQAASRQMREDFNEAKGTIMVLGEEIGVHLPRHVQSFVAKLPGAAEALSAAFSAVAVFAIGEAIFEAGKKLAEFVEKTEEAGRKNREAWDEVSKSTGQAREELQLANDKIQDQIAKLQGKPRNGIKEAIDEAILSARQLGASLDEDLKKIGATLKEQQVGLWGQIQGFAGTSGLTGRPQALSDKLNGIDVSGRQKLAQLRAQGATEDQLATATKELADKRKAAIDAELAWANQQIEAIHNKKYGLMGGLDQSKRLGLLEEYAARLGDLSDIVDLTQQKGVGETQLQGLQGKASDKNIMTVNLADLANAQAEEFSKNQDANAAFAAQLAAKKTAEELAKEQAMQTTDFNPGDTIASEFADWNMMWEYQQPKVNQFLDNMKAVADRFTNLNQVLSNLMIEGVDGFNDVLMKIMSSPRNTMRGKHPWDQLGASMAESAGKSTLQYGEGELFKLITGKNPMAKLGTQGNPMWVKNVDSVASGGSAAGAAASLFGAGAAAGGSGSSSGSGSGIGSFFSSIFKGLTGFADGGDVAAGVPVMVGERGPEPFIPSTSGTIIPNGAFGGDTHQHINIDARGATDPAATAAQMHRVMAGYLPQMKELAKAAVVDHNRRNVSRNRI